MKKTLPIVIAVAVIVGGGAFYGGMKYAQGKSASQRPNFQNFSGNFASGTTARFGRNGSGTTGGNFVSGQILSADASSITIKTQNGGSQIVLFSDSTPIEKFGSGTPSDLKAGESITVTGTQNQDGSLSASSIQLGRPEFSTSSATNQ